MKEFDTPYTPAHTLILALRAVAAADQGRGDRERLAAAPADERGLPGGRPGARAGALQRPARRGPDRLPRPRRAEGRRHPQQARRAVRHHDRRRPGQAQGQDRPRSATWATSTSSTSIAGLAALEMVLTDLGYDVEPGARRDRRAAGPARAEERPAGRLSSTIRRASVETPAMRLAVVRRICTDYRESATVAHRVLVTDKLAEEGLALLRAEPGLEVVVNTKLDPAALRAGAGRGRRDRDPVGDAADGRGPRATSPGSRRSSAPGSGSTTSTSRPRPGRGSW